jgi:hypothetical protein
VDWNSDGEWDIISGDRNGYLNVFIRHDDTLTAYKMYQDIHGTAMDVGSNSEPNLFDWNGDGMRDLIIGEQSYQVRVYLNQSSDTWPLFDNSSYTTVYAGGSQVYFYRVNPYMFDLNGDGLLDLICGEQNGYVHYFENITTDSVAEFAAGETLKLYDGRYARWSRTSYYYGSRCGFGDWNNDSIPDFLLSTYEGQIELYRGMAPTGIEELKGPCIRDFTISPNPGSRVRIDFNLRRSADARIEIVDGLGRTVRNLGTVDAGEYRSVEWDGTDDQGRQLAAGVYFCRLKAGEDSKTGRVVLSR